MHLMSARQVEGLPFIFGLPVYLPVYIFTAFLRLRVEPDPFEYTFKSNPGGTYLWYIGNSLDSTSKHTGALYHSGSHGR